MPTLTKTSTNSRSFPNANQTSSPYELRHSAWTFPSLSCSKSSIGSSSRTESTSLATRSESPDTVRGDDEINGCLKTIEIDDDDHPTLQEISMPRAYWDLTRESQDVDDMTGITHNFHDDDFMDSDAFDEWTANKERRIRTSRQLTESSQRILVVRPRRNDRVIFPLECLQNFSHNGVDLRPEITVELENGSFMRVAHVIRDVSIGEVFLRGNLFWRTNELNGWLEKKLNEVCMIIQVDQDDGRPPEEQGMEDVNINMVKRKRVLKLTNQSFPKLSFRDEQTSGMDVLRIKKEEVLVCRWRFIRFYANASARLKKKDSPCEFAMLRLRKEDCSHYAIEDDKLRRSWRGETISGGTHPTDETENLHTTSFSTRTAYVDLSEPENILVKHPTVSMSTGLSQKKLAERQQRDSSIKRNRRRHKQMYTFGDGFCGAGGTSRGATMAGLHVQWGFDMDENACESWGLNWPNATISQLMANEFVMDPDLNAFVDILHLSPPCQFFSPAHTVVGQNDEKNTASSFATGDLLEKTMPRVVTIENTHGLWQRHGDYMSGTINQFTSKGFSIRWKILNFADFGLPQKRHRLVIIASW